MDFSPVSARQLGLAALAVCGLAACSDFGGKGNTYTCPLAITSPDLQTYANVPPGGDPNNVVSAGRITAVSVTCSRETGGVKADVLVNITAMRTNTGLTQLNLPYFVAMSDNDGNVLGKQEFTVGMKFPAAEPQIGTIEKVTAHLPLKNLQLANIYTLVVGFQLSPEQLSFNRAHLK